MKYCPCCQLDIDAQHTRCPLCGAELTRSPRQTQLRNAENKPNITQRPYCSVLTMNTQYKQRLVRILALILAVVCATINFVWTPQIFWSGFVIVLLILSTNNTLNRAIHKGNAVAKIVSATAILTVVALSSEYCVHNTVFPNICLCKVLPWLYVTAVLIADTAFVYKRTATNGMYSSVFVCSAICIVPKVLCAISHSTLTHFDHIVTTALCVVGTVNTIIMIVLFGKYVKEETKRKFSI